jgi:hypothetical protein
MSADGAVGSHRQVVDGLLDVINELATDGPTDDELALWHQSREQLRGAPQAVLAQLDGSAERRALGLDTFSPEEAEERWHSLDVNQLRVGLAEVLDTMLVIGPDDVGAEVESLATLTDWSDDQTLGDEYVPIDGREQGTLVIGEEAVCWILDEARYRTIRWNEAAAVTAWDSGVRSIIGPAGMSVVVVPWNWRNGEGLPELIDERIGRRRLINLGEGSTEYRRDQADPESVVQVRWLASLVGVRHRGDLVDIALMTDGLLVLHGRGTASTQERLKDMRSVPRDELVKKATSHEWWPLDTIGSVTLGKPSFLRLGKAKASVAVLRIVDTDSRPFLFDLLIHDQVKSVQNEFPRALGATFVSTM